MTGCGGWGSSRSRPSSSRFLKGSFGPLFITSYRRYVGSVVPRPHHLQCFVTVHFAQFFCVHVKKHVVHSIWHVRCEVENCTLLAQRHGVGALSLMQIISNACCLLLEWHTVLYSGHTTLLCTLRLHLRLPFKLNVRTPGGACSCHYVSNQDVLKASWIFKKTENNLHMEPHESPEASRKHLWPKTPCNNPPPHHPWPPLSSPLNSAPQSSSPFPRATLNTPPLSPPPAWIVLGLHSPALLEPLPMTSSAALLPDALVNIVQGPAMHACGRRVLQFESLSVSVLLYECEMCLSVCLCISTCVCNSTYVCTSTCVF